MTPDIPRITTGIKGLDEILRGGFIPKRAYLVRGGPGVGKTILGLHFLAAGAAAGERVLCITLSESEETIRLNASTLDLDISGVEFLDLRPSPELFTKPDAYYDIFHPSEVERKPVTEKLLDALERLKPTRVFIDPTTQLRYLSRDIGNFRRQIAAFLGFLESHDATVLISSESFRAEEDADLQFIADGIINLEIKADTRTVQVAKFRGTDVRLGRHAARIARKGMEVFPHLVPQEYHKGSKPEKISSGINEMDALLHGGIERGTVTLVAGPTGVGKTTLGLLFMVEAARRGEYSVLFSFEEEADAVSHRCKAINIPISGMIEAGTLSIIKIEPLVRSADEFASMVRHEVEERDARVVMIDTVNRLSLSLRGEDLLDHVHALGRYLSNMGVTAIFILEAEQIGFRGFTGIGASYLADSIIYMRFIERHSAEGVELRKGVFVLKMRQSDFDRSVHEFRITAKGVSVGPAIPSLTTILGDTPIWTDQERQA